MQIGITEAKARLSALIAAAERGEEVIITRWGRPVARLVAIRKPRPDSGAGAGDEVRDGNPISPTAHRLPAGEKN
jgi:prevent-host-death family protein